MTAKSRSGFTVVEILMVVGVILILVSLLLPSLARARSVSLASVNASNMRQMAIGLRLYADSNRDGPPTFSAPAWPPSQPWNLGFGPMGNGGWFDHSWLYSYAITAEVGDTSVANAAGKPTPFPVVEYNGELASMSDYMLTHTLYAAPAFFSVETRQGVSQFGMQRLSSILFPSDKGILKQGIMYHFKDHGPVQACCVFDLPSPVAFGDLSVSEHVVKRMPKGVFNPYSTVLLPPGIDPDTVPGSAIMDTLNGIAGRDR